jgi:DNA-binding NarL/FixJ family response regulator
MLKNRMPNTMQEALTHQIAIIEDNKTIREGVAMYINMQQDMQLKVQHDSVESFLHALENPNLEKPTILLLDIGLPGMSGVEGIPLILKKLPDLSIIMLTTYEEETTILKALCSGACSYLSKKASLEEILMGGRVSKATILTKQQKLILEKMTDGKSYTAIAKEMQLAPETIRSHIKRMYKRLHINNKAEAIAMYLRGEIS